MILGNSLAKMKAKTPVGWKQWPPNKFSVLANDVSRGRSQKDVKIEDSSNGSEGQRRKRLHKYIWKFMYVCMYRIEIFSFIVKTTHLFLHSFLWGWHPVRAYKTYSTCITHKPGSTPAVTEKFPTTYRPIADYFSIGRKTRMPFLYKCTLP